MDGQTRSLLIEFFIISTPTFLYVYPPLIPGQLMSMRCLFISGLTFPLIYSTGPGFAKCESI